MLLLCVTRSSVRSFAPRAGVALSLQGIHVSQLSVAAASPSTQTPIIYSRFLHPSSTARRFVGTELFGTGSEEPSTGWLHNQPRPEFQQDQNKNDGHPKEELRTGWLHRTESRRETESGTGTTSSPSPQLQVSSTTSTTSTSDIARRLREDMSRQQRNHRITTPPTLYPSGEEGRTIVITEHRIAVPLRRDTSTSIGKNKSDPEEDFTPEVLNADKPTVDVFFRVVDLIATDNNHATDIKFFHSLNSMSPKERATAYVRHNDLKDMKKGFLYLQGGPGFGAPSPISGIGLTSKSSWAGAALSHGFNKIVLLDQRGTGRSVCFDAALNKLR
jgi:hypothetical protein